MTDWNIGDRVYDLKIFRLTGKMMEGTVVKESKTRSSGVYVTWDCDLGLLEFMYDDELDRLEV